MSLVRFSLACNFQNNFMWKWKSAGPTNTRKAGYAHAVRSDIIQRMPRKGCYLSIAFVFETPSNSNTIQISVHAYFSFFPKTYSGKLAGPSLVLFRVKCYPLTNGKWSVPQRLKRLIENTYHSWKVSTGLKELSPGGWGGGTERSCIQGGSIPRFFPFYRSFYKEEGTFFGRSFSL